jgi:hypothetical protein
MNKKLSIITGLIILFLLLALISGCKPYDVKEDDEKRFIKPTSDTKSPVISYEVIGGLMTHKEEMNIFLNGKVEYNLELVKDKYFRTASISKEELDRLIKLFNDNNFISFKDSYGSRVPVADARKTIIEFKEKRVSVESSAQIPKELEEIKQEVVKKAEWFKSLLPELEFTKVKGKCSVEVGSGSTNIELRDSNIVFTGKINTANPCYELSANIETNQDILNPKQGVITVTINSSPSRDLCIQCTGVVEFSGRITNLSGMEKYKVIIKSKDIVIGENELQMPFVSFKP